MSGKNYTMGGVIFKEYHDGENTKYLVDALCCLDFEKRAAENEVDFSNRVYKEIYDRLNKWPERFKKAVEDKGGSVE